MNRPSVFEFANRSRWFGLRENKNMNIQNSRTLEKIRDNVSRKTKQWEIVCEETDETHLSFSNNALKSVSSHKRFGMGLRVICNGRIGFSSTTRPDSKTLAQDALSSAAFGQTCFFSFPENSLTPSAAIYDKSLCDVDMRELKSLGTRAIGKLRDAFPEAQCDADIGAARGRVTLVNSSGFHGSYEKTTAGFFAGALLTQKDGLLEVHDGHAQCAAGIDADEIVSRIIRKLKYCKKNVTVPTGKYDVIFSPSAFSQILSALRPGVSGKMIQKGMSPLMGKLGEKLFDAAITLWDDPLRDGAVLSQPFDGEGVPSIRKAILEKGALKNYLLDLQTAGQLHMASTGNASRNYSSQPSPAPSTWVVEGGNEPLKTMLRNVKDGIMIDELIGWAGNPLAGEFSGNVGMGFKIQNGKLTARVKDCIVSGNIFSLFSSVGALSREQEWVHGSVLCPYAFFENVSVAGKG